MCPSSWKLNFDDFPFYETSVAHLEAELQLFEVDDNDQPAESSKYGPFFKTL